MTPKMATDKVKHTATHTPGEWKSELIGTNSGQWLTIYVDDDGWDGGKRELFESETVRTAVGRRNTLKPRFRDTKDAKQIRANVALAMAAPDLLDALRAIVNHPAVREVLAPKESLGSLIAFAEAAIKKAEAPCPTK